MIYTSLGCSFVSLTPLASPGFQFPLDATPSSPHLMFFFFYPAPFFERITPTRSDPVHPHPEILFFFTSFIDSPSPGGWIGFPWCEVLYRPFLQPPSNFRSLRRDLPLPMFPPLFVHTNFMDFGIFFFTRPIAVGWISLFPCLLFLLFRLHCQCAPPSSPSWPLNIILPSCLFFIAAWSLPFCRRWVCFPPCGACVSPRSSPFSHPPFFLG